MEKSLTGRGKIAGSLSMGRLADKTSLRGGKDVGNGVLSKMVRDIPGLQEKKERKQRVPPNPKERKKRILNAAKAFE